MLIHGADERVKKHSAVNNLRPKGNMLSAQEFKVIEQEIPGNEIP